MRAIIQRVNSAQVIVDENTVGEIQNGYLIYLGITHTDTSFTADKLIDKILKIRLFPSESKPINANISSVEGEILVISQFTLYASTKKGNRPNFMLAAKPEQAKLLYDYFVKKLDTEYEHKIASGCFGADMKVISENDGPINIIVDID
ncbi:D-aminoacyl-tRNA deacylase [Psychroflexus sp. ALD_RP9]|uniref:D-aminoacyl-tRNA deacylase n=1 Tax=Psychroflexus sp. ALD_RP9 TaxID=2777186 RepID=UPI001A8EED29|nr:D-aminoacyl-tRNA deacylase [Psychroflexus sp. ALD_RP9]QSS97130.1 D-tyrosyl-tRNA(Tyr) deacylase [Psychroflexus sp. ALD_RP9]